MKGIRRTIVYMQRYWLTAVGAFISILAVNAATLLVPQIIRSLIDTGIGQKNFRYVLFLSLLLIGVAVVRGVFNFLQGYWSELTSQGVAYDLRNNIFNKLQKLSFSYHDRAQTGNLMTRMTSDVELVRMFTGTGLIQMISAFVMLIGTLVILFRMNWYLTLIFVGMLPIIGVIFFLFVRYILPLSKEVQERLGVLNTTLQENLAGVRVVKAFSREAYETERYLKQNRELMQSNVALMTIFARYFPTIFFVANAAIAIVLWTGGIQVMQKQMTIGELIAFISYQGFFLMPVFMLGMVGSSMSRAEASAQRLFEIIDADIEISDLPEAFPMPTVNGRVSFEQVGFRYRGSSQDVIRNITFQVEAGQLTAILGHTGAGKSTIINLIPRFYDPTQGVIRIDDMDIKKVTLHSLRAQIGIVLQDTTLFSGTIQENIAYGCPDASLVSVMQAARVAQADEFIRNLPQGYETIIGERGVGLSGGQRQRLAIARAILLNPRILIMDDSTSSVDAETDFLIQQALEKLLQGRTTFIIAQRLSTLRKADQILLLDHGQLIAKGTHSELLQTNETYAEILQTQFGVKPEMIRAEGMVSYDA